MLLLCCVVVVVACWFPVAFLKTFLLNFFVPSSLFFVPVLFALNHPRSSSSSSSWAGLGRERTTAPLRDVYARPGLWYFSKWLDLFARVARHPRAAQAGQDQVQVATFVVCAKRRKKTEKKTKSTKLNWFFFLRAERALWISCTGKCIGKVYGKLISFADSAADWNNRKWRSGGIA